MLIDLLSVKRTEKTLLCVPDQIFPGGNKPLRSVCQEEKEALRHRSCKISRPPAWRCPFPALELAGRRRDLVEESLSRDYGAFFLLFMSNFDAPARGQRYYGKR
jgi:hypothetical protein